MFFVELLCPHHFIANEQAKYKDCKLHLSPGEMLVTVDFSVLQDAAQGYHWNNLQATLHPFVGYYIDSGEIQHLSYVIISECLSGIFLPLLTAKGPVMALVELLNDWQLEQVCSVHMTSKYVSCLIGQQ